MLQTVGAVLGAGWQSGKFLYVDTDLKIDLPEARVVIDRDQVADLGLDLASVGRELGTLLGGGYVNRFNYFDRSYKVIPQIGDDRRATVGPLLDLKIKTPSGRLVPVSTFTHIESSTAPRTLNRFQQRNAVRIFGGVKPGVTTEEGLRAMNGILIVQFANTLQSQGVAKLVALREASLTRLRPVLMTSAATVFGHLPLVFATGPGSAARNSIGTVLVAGMTVGTVFTLFVVPVFYSLIAAEHRPETADGEDLVLQPAMVEEAAHA